MRVLGTDITDLENAATLLIDTIPLKNCEEFQMRYCALLWLKGLQNYQRFKKKDEKSG